MIGELKQALFTNIKNIPGWKTNRKILIIECDDWGGIRMPSKQAYKRLESLGLAVGTSRFNKYDTLANTRDFEYLFSVLQSVKDHNGNSAVLTAISNVANPDFSKIMDADYSQYIYEPFTETLKKYYPEEDVFAKWQEGIREGIFIPELHGKEHICVPLWMEALQSGSRDVLKAFMHEFVSVQVNDTDINASEFRPEFYFNKEIQKTFLKNSCKEGINLFENIFGYKPRVFVPANGVFHPDFDKIVVNNGIKYLYTSHSMPYPNGNGGFHYRWFYPGQKGIDGLRYYTRNCAFEPTDTSYSGIDFTMKQIGAAFRWGKAANISTHRANFVGAIDPQNRSKGLNELSVLLKAIVTKWPEVEFMSSADGLKVMEGELSN